MTFTVPELIKYFIALMALINPIEGMAVYLSMSSSINKNDRAGFIRRASVAVFIILAVSLLIGGLVLSLFGVSVAAFQLAGGILLFLIALQMALPGSSSNDTALEGGPNAAIVPLALPILVGPGVIASAILYGTYCHNPADYSVMTLMMFAAALLVFIGLKIADRVGGKLSPVTIEISTRLCGLIVAAIAMEMMVKALLELFPGLGK
ncbi:MAG: MarC family protein [Fimbriimonadaceae bacterium]